MVLLSRTIVRCILLMRSRYRNAASRTVMVPQLTIKLGGIAFIDRSIMDYSTRRATMSDRGSARFAPPAGDEQAHKGCCSARATPGEAALVEAMKHCVLHDIGPERRRSRAADVTALDAARRLPYDIRRAKGPATVRGDKVLAFHQ